MEENNLLELLENNPTLKYERINHSDLFSDPDDEHFHYNISGFKGNPDIEFQIGNDERVEILSQIVEIDFEFIPEFLAIKIGDTIQIAYRPISRSSYSLRRRLSESSITCKMEYFKNSLEIELLKRDTEKTLSNFLKLKGRGPVYQILEIRGFNKQHEEELSEDLRKILNCYFFDLTYNFQFSIEAISFESLRRRSAIRRRRIEIPEEPINIVYKDYITELIEYFYIGEKVDYAPFRFICYFHIIEYFSDKSAYHLAAQKLKAMMLKPDFHMRTDKYVNQAINFFKTESTKFTGDKVKIKRVINQFINKEELEDYLKTVNLFDYFIEECVLECNKDLKLPALDFESQSKFEETLTKRIYSMRCSIVHSNPDFDETKAIPFKPSPQNMEKLRKEIEMIFAVARQIILASKS